MIPSDTEVLEVESTLDGEVVPMTIDENSLANVMEVLTNLYSDSEAAVIREYSTNAWDAHVAAGNPMPILVDTPSTLLSPSLRIKDFGVGLDAKDIRDIYSRYGLSTKMETNEQTGSLGLGCKSALAYTHQFTMVGVKNGYRTTVSISKDDEGIGEQTIVDVSPTNDPSGVEIIIPAQRYNKFAEKAARLFKYWPEGSVLLDGKEPERITDGLVISPKIRLLKRQNGGDYSYKTQSYVSKSYVVMANVPYPVDPEQFDLGLEGGYYIVATIPNGTVHFHPSREHLRYTKRTIKALEHLKETFCTELVSAVNKEIDGAVSMPEALRAVIKWRQSIPGKISRDLVFTYKSVPLPDSIAAANDGAVFLVSQGKRETDWNGKNIKVGAHSRMHAIDLTMVPDALWVYGFQRTFTPAVKKKLWLWWDQNRKAADGSKLPYPQNFIICGEKPTSPWIDSDRIVPWEPIEALKLPRVNPTTGRTTSGRIPGSYDMWIASDGDLVSAGDTPADDIDTSLPVYYHMVVSGKQSGHSQANRLAQLEDDFTLVLLTCNRVAKFCRLFPGTQSFHQVYKTYWEQWWNEILTDQDRSLLSFHQRRFHDHEYGIADLARLSLVELEDPDLVRWGRMYRAKDSLRYRQLAANLKIFNGVAEIPLFSEPTPLRRYPLFRSIGSATSATHRKHNKLYLNAAYQAFHQEN